MASEKDATCENDPNFAIICAFFQKFSTMLNIGHPDIQLLKEWLENTDEVSPGLKDLHIKLLRKLRKIVHETAWETALSKFCYIYSSQDAWEIERFGYKKSSLKVKLRILKELVEYQFDKNGKFRTYLSALSARDLRGEPIGRDKLGHSYWLTQDHHCNIRIYQEHLDEEIWQVVATNREELVTLITRLKGNEVVLPSLVSVVDEDSSSNSCPVAIVKPPPPEEQDESLDEKTNSSEGKIPNIKIKLDTNKILATTNGNAEEEEVESESESEYRGEEEADLEGFDSEDDKVESKENKENIEEGSKGGTVKYGKLNGELNGSINGDKEIEKETDKKSNDSLDNSNQDGRKVKPIVISQSKITNDKVSKKRLLEDQEKSAEEDNPSKKTRPTLLGINREKKISKYEKFKDESEDDDEEGEEEDDEEEATEEEEEAAAEEEDEEVAGEEEDEEAAAEDEDEEAAVEEEEEEHAAEEEDEELGEEEEEVGEEIEEELMVIKCDGNGKECESSYLDFLKLSEDLNDDSWVGEEIEEEVMIVTGEGWGNDCLVGNSKDDNDEVCIQKQNCEKVSVIKKDCTEISNSKNRNCSDDQKEEVEKDITDESVDELTNGEKASNNKLNAKKVNNSTNSSSNNDNSVEKEEDHKSPSPASDKESKTNVVPKIEITEVIESEKPVNSKEDVEEDKVKVPDPPQDCKKPEEELKPPSPAEVPQKKETSSSVPLIKETASSVSLKTDTSSNILPNRKRRLSEERPRPVSESESDLNSEIVEEQTQEDVDVGGKRPKMRCKIINTNMRKKVEAERNYVNKESSSSSEEDSPEKEKEKESPENVSPKSPEKEKNEDTEICKKEDNNEELVPEKEPDKNEEKGVEDLKNVEPEKKEEDNKSLENSSKTDDKCIEDAEDSSKKEAVPKEELPKMPKSPSPVEEVAQIQTRSGRKKPAVPFQTKRRRRGKKPKKEEKHEEVEKQEDVEKQEEEEKPEEEKIADEEPAAKVEKPEEPPELPEPSKESSLVANNSSNSSNETPPENKTATPPSSTSKEAVKRKQRKKREIDVSNIIEADNDVTPVRQSRRIAQLKIKEEAERRKLEEIALKKMKEELKKKKKEEKKNTKDEPEKSEKSDSSSDKNESLYSEVEIKKKVEKKKRGLKKGGWSSGTEDEPEEEEEEFQYETDVGSPLFKSDHEFSPESDIEDESQIVPTKRARTARREGEEGSADVEVSDEACQKCGKTDHPEWILLCDKCDKGYHCSCLSPVLFMIPEGDWFCPPCQQEELILALESHLKDFDDLIIQKKEEEEIRARNLILEKERLELMASIPAPVKQPRNKSGRRIRKNSSLYSSRSNDSSRSGGSSSKSSGSSSSSSSSSSSGSRSSATDSEDEPIYKLRKRRQINVSYRFHEYDDLINSAIKEEMDEVAGAGNLGRGKDISTIIEADKEEKLRLKQLEARKGIESLEPKDIKTSDVEVKANPVLQGDEQSTDVKTEQAIKEDSGSDFEPLKSKPKLSSRKNLKKKNRKLNSLDISSDDDGSDEDFKTSSYETEEEDESISAGGSESDSSLEIYKHKSKKNKKSSRRSSRRAARNRRKRYDDEFIVDDSDFSEEFPKIKKKRKEDSDYTESESEEELSEDVDSEDLCDDSTESDSDGAWRPSKRKKQRTSSKRKQQKKSFSSSSRKQKKHRRPDHEKSFKAGISKNRIPDYDDDDNSRDSSRKTRGRRFTYLEDYEDESSDDGIKPGVKRPDTPPEEREKFIRRQEEIKRMLAEKNTEAAKVAATPTLAPIARSNKTDPPADSSASLSTVPLSVIRSAKALDIEYLQRRGELESEDNETDDFDDDLPDDFNPEDMDEEEIAKMMEEEDFAQHQLKLAGEVIRQKKLKEIDLPPRPEEIRIPRATPAPIYDTTRKRFPIPTPHPPLRNPPFGHFSHPSYARSSMLPSRSMPPMHSNRSMLPPPLQTNPPSVHANPLAQQANSSPTVQAISSVPNSQIPTVVSQASPHEPLKPRGRRKKITPLRDTLQKQQAAAAAAAAAAATTTPSLSGMSPGQAKPQSVPSGPLGPAGPSLQAAQLNKDPAVGDKVTGPNLSVAQPPQLYKPSNTQPSVITRMAQPASRPRFSEQGSRFFPGLPGAMGQRPPPTRPPPMSVTTPPHHTMRPSYSSGPPPLRPVNSAPPPTGSIGNGIGRHPMPPRQPPPFASSEQFNMRPRTAPPLNPYRPPLFGTPGYPPVPPGHSAPPGPPPPQPPSSLHSADNAFSAPSFTTAPFGNFYPPPIGSTHSTPPPPTATAVPSSVIVSATANTSPPPPPAVVPVPPSVAESMQQSISPRPKATPLETFDSKSTPPPDIDSARSPYDTNSTPADENDEANVIRNSTSEFSGLVSYFSSQQDDLNT